MYRWILVIGMGGFFPLGHAPADHPLDSLSEWEIDAAVRLVYRQEGMDANLLFPCIVVAEPSKEDLAAFAAGKAIDRCVSAVVYAPETGRVTEAIINLTQQRIDAWENVPGVKAAATTLEYLAAEHIVRNDRAWQRAMRKRVNDLDYIYVCPVASGEPLDDAGRGARLFRVYCYDQQGVTNSLGRPIEGVMAIVDLTTERVIQLIDDEHVIPVPGRDADFFDPRVRGRDRDPLQPLRSHQPFGPSFLIDGQEIRWEKWRFRYSLHPREGLVLHTVSYRDGERDRPILHRASLSEMVVPYADLDPLWNWRVIFDQGEYGMGRYANTLQLGRDVPENTVLFDAVFADDYGNPSTQPDAVALFERDGGVLWKHTEDSQFDTVASRRARELVIGYVTTLGNYDYGFQWIFRQDGSIQARVDMTGIMQVKAVAAQECTLCQQIDQLQDDPRELLVVEPEGDQRYGTLVGEGVIGVNHQHLFNFRLDFDVDGTSNSICEMNVRAEADDRNPAGNAFIQEETHFAQEHEARRWVDYTSHRCWKVFNPHERNALGHHTGYALIPAENGVPYLSANTSVRRRAGFMDHHMWVTQFHADEMHAAGDYPRQNPNTDGLGNWSGKESIRDEDLVVWYTLAATHIPRPEEWPVMPATQVGFRLVPWGFFSQNPALDVPETPGVR